MTSTAEKPRICLALPGIQYTPQSPYVRSTLPMVPYLEKDFEVTLLYRKMVDVQSHDHIEHRYTTLIDPETASAREQRNTFPYYEPQHYPALWAYQRTIQEFAETHAQRFDLVFEKEWPWLGMVTQAFADQGVPTSMLIEAMYKRQPSTSRSLSKRLAGLGLPQMRLRKRKEWAQAADSIVVETEEMEAVLRDIGYVQPQTPMYPIPYGVDPEIFCPRDRQDCRTQLGIDPDQFVLAYVGSLNRFIQEPAPIIEALGRVKPKNVVLHMVGDGSKRHELEAIAQSVKAPVVFHGRLPQRQAALFVGAANVAIAPYNKSLYLGDRFTCASLKVPEYLSCGRLVLTIPCERMDTLTDHEKYGYLVPNTVEGYTQFFQALPSVDAMVEAERQLIQDIEAGVLKQKKILLRWWDIAELYKQAIDETLGLGAQPVAAAR